LDIQGLLGDTDATPTAVGLAGRVIQQESAGNANAVNARTGASGLMQVMQATARDPGFGVKPLAWEDRFDPAENVRFGTEYLQAMLDKFDGDQVRALAAYNWGPGNAERWSGDMKDLPAETRDYIESILGTSSEQSFSSEDEVNSAIDSGQVSVGDVVIVNGVRMRVENDG
jgi:soluble lytic murein transglycosylase-like protein